MILPNARVCISRSKPYKSQSSRIYCIIIRGPTACLTHSPCDSNHMWPITNHTRPIISREVRMLLDKWLMAWLRSSSLCPSSFHLTCTGGVHHHKEAATTQQRQGYTGTRKKVVEGRHPRRKTRGVGRWGRGVMVVFPAVVDILLSYH